MTKRLMWAVISIALVLVFSGGLLMARQGIVKTKDGQTLEGDVNELEEAVTITTPGGQTTVPRDNVASIQYVQGIVQQYQERAAKLPKDGDPKGHLDLAKWLFENKQYNLARNELDTVLRLDPNNAEATTLYATVQSQMRLERLHPTVTPPVAPPPAGQPPVGPPATERAKPPVPAGDVRFLSPADINIIRQMEWPTDDKTVRIHLEGDVRKRFMNYVNYSPDDVKKFLAETPTDEALDMLQHGLPEMRSDIKILNDPAPLAEYRRAVQPLILSGCAAAGCHGSANNAAGAKFFLYALPDSEPAAYTNFYLLTKYRKAIDGAQRRMIDRTFPAKSLLVQFAMPTDASEIHHPDIAPNTPWKGIAGGFRNGGDVGSHKLITWMSTLVPFDPDYGIKFALPEKPAPATQGAGAEPHNPIVPAAGLPLPPHTPPPAAP